MVHPYERPGRRGDLRPAGEYVVPTLERLASMTRRERDEREADLAGLEGAEREAFLLRLEEFDRNTIRLARMGAIEACDTREGMLARVDAVIADLVEQLGEGVAPWPA